MQFKGARRLCSIRNRFKIGSKCYNANPAVSACCRELRATAAVAAVSWVQLGPKNIKL